MDAVTLPTRLPIEGFVLAGGQSLRMGRDKATAEFRGRAMVEIACETLRSFCASVAIAGNREELSRFAPVVTEQRVRCGPAAGVEAGLKVCGQPWAMFVPVDVPLAPAGLLERWARAVLARPGCVASYLQAAGEQPSFCMLRPEAGERWTASLDGGERRLRALLRECAVAADGLWKADASQFVELPAEEREDALREWFRNVNTPAELEGGEATRPVTFR